MPSTLRTTGVVASFTCSIVLGAAAIAADAPTADKALRLQPVQNDVQIDIPEGQEIAKCTVQAERIGKINGWVVRDSQGVPLRRFLDTNGDNFVDQWCYFHFGIEVYRDIDTNFNQKADQYRWLNTAGSRIGIDANEDKKIDAWRNISAEEVTYEIVGAIRDRDPARFAPLLLTDKELPALGLGKERGEQLAKKLQLAPANFATLVKEQTLIAPGTKWVSFAGSQPGIVPAGTEDSTADILAYENVAAMIETDGKPQALTVGTLVRTAGGWRLIDAPQIDAADVATTEPRNFFFAAPRSERPDSKDVVDRPSDKAQELMKELHKLGDMTPGDAPDKHKQRAELLEALAEEGNGEMRSTWYRQLADMLSAAVQSGSYPDGIERLKVLEKKLKADPKNEELAFYAQFRGMVAEHGQALSTEGQQNFQAIQTQWIADLETFVSAANKYPDSAEAMLELAISHEFGGDDDKALKWYGTIARDFPDAAIHDKAEGAQRRLSSVGQSIPLTGKLVTGEGFDLARLKGKVVLIQYWATWCEPCKADMPLLKELRAKFKDNFEVIGVNLDNDKQEMAAYLRQNDPRWPQLFEDGGLESRFAEEMGIQTLPTMILIDKEGRVVDRNIRAQGLESEIIRLLK